MSERYIREKLWVAVNILATGGGDNPGARCLRLHEQHHPIAKRRLHDDPEALARYGAIRERITALPAEADEGTVAATVARMSDDEAQRLAQAIAELNDHYRPI